MTVRELIRELDKISDKDREVMVPEDDMAMRSCNNIVADDELGNPIYTNKAILLTYNEG